MKRILSLAVCFWMLGWGLAVARTPQQPEKSQKVYYNAFSHNDYEHERPLFDALDLGFNCVEADLWLIDGELVCIARQAGNIIGYHLRKTVFTSFG